MFGATNIVKTSDKAKWFISSYGIAFDGAGPWIFVNDFARNVVIFGVNNSSSSHSENCKIIFLVFGERPPDGINGSFGSPEKNV